MIGTLYGHLRTSVSFMIGGKPEQDEKKRKRDEKDNSDGDDDPIIHDCPVKKRVKTRAVKRTVGVASQRNASNQYESDLDNIRVATTAPKTKRARSALVELDIQQFQNKLRLPTAFCQRPRYDPAFLAQFTNATLGAPKARDSKNATVKADRAACEREVNNKTASRQNVGRSKRAAARVAYVDMSLANDDPDDERLARPPAPVGKRSSAKRKAAAAESDASEFENDGRSKEYESSAYEMEEDSDNEGDNDEQNEYESEDEADIFRKKRPARPTVNRSSGKGGSKTTVKTSKKLMHSLISRKAAESASSYPPLIEIDEIFSDLTQRAYEGGLQEALQHLAGRPLRVATMCSGTESPLLAIEMIQEALKAGCAETININHLFSAEIVPFKQAYIERNFKPPIIFRDITELTSAVDDVSPVATTAYGGKVSVPREVDIVIAGTSCVDFSGLNAHKKGIHDGGESGDTWHAVLAFCRKFRPAIVLLENVMNADWDTMLLDYRKIGYDSAGVHVDTKDYYIPHTRQRGYMACFDKERIKGEPKAISSTWVEWMSKMKRPASSPSSSFLMSSDRVGQRRQIRDDEPTREKDWAKCQITQMQYRVNKRLGYARPITHWSESGSLLVPENYDKAWSTKQVERVLDTLDAAHLRKALPQYGMYDTRYKTRIWDLSQNIYRNEDHAPFGLIGCITPSGQYFVSDLGRAMAAEELLKLQGLPLSKISFTTESPSQIQDLAGNAMSSTVIGSSILSALVAGYRLFDHDQNCDPTPSVQAVQAARPMLLDNQEMQPVKPRVTSREIDVAGLRNQARHAFRSCFCEGSRGVAQKPIQRCRDCDHTTCIACGGNPVHNYKQEHSANRCQRSPRDFERQLRAALPLRLDFRQVEPPLFFEGVLDAYLQAVRAAFSGSFSFHEIKRTHCWVVVYRDENASLHLAFEEDGNIEWQLFAHPNSSLPANDPLRALLRHPIAKCVVQNNLFGSTCRWLVRVPKPQTLRITITGSGAAIASWWSKNEMPDFVEHTLPERLSITFEGDKKGIRSIAGEYLYLPHCGTACDGLYKKSNNSSKPLYLFLDPTRIGEPGDDCFVFSHNKSLLEQDEVRPLLARVAAPWRPWPTVDAKKSSGGSTKIIVDDLWEATSYQLRLMNVEFEIHKAEPHLYTMFDSVRGCDHATALVSISSGVIEPDRARETPLNHEIEANNERFFEKHGWTFEAMRRALPSERWFTLTLPPDLDPACLTCAPSTPALRWRLDGNDIEPVEDVASAAAYEKAIKLRPRPFAISLLELGGRTKLTFGVNVASLAHKAIARLPKAVRANSSTCWKLFTAEDNDFSFKPFRLQPTRNIEPFGKSLRMTVELFPQQRLSLAWMRSQESGDALYVLERSEEATIPALKWRVEARASASISVRGGICADHPGFGKTITSLALIQSYFDQPMEKILGELERRRSAEAAGLLAITATLIICPSSLVQQWAEEISDKLQYSGKPDVIVVKKLGDLAKLSLNDFKQARIIVVNRALLGTEGYIERLASFAAMPGPAGNSGRAFAKWLEVATQAVPPHLKVLLEGGEGKLRQHVQATYRSNIESEAFQSVIPSRRLRGKNYVAESDRNVKDKKPTTRTAAAKEVDTAYISRPLFEMFLWNRIIVDEIHSYEPWEYAAIANLKSDKRWGLSATPELNDFYDIAQMAGFLGVPLRIGSDARGVMKAKNISKLRKELTKAELFDMMRELPSDATHARIHEIDQEFLDRFVRQNVMSFNDFPFQDHLVPVVLELEHQVLYTEMSQHLNSNEMRLKKISKKKNTDRWQRINDAVASSSTAEEALSKTAAYFGGPDIDELIHTRDAQVEDTVQRLPAAIAAARKEGVTFTEWKHSRLEKKTLGDAEVTNEILKLVGHKRKVEDSKKAEKDGSARASTADLNALCERLLVARRSLRYLTTVQQLQEVVREGGKVCHAPNCGTETADVAISALCGHAVCRQCYDELRSEARTICPANGCSSAMHDHHLLWADKIGGLQPPSSSQSGYGAKIRAAVKILKRIRRKGDQAVLFVQFDNQLDEVELALRKEGIAAIVVKTTAKAGSEIAAFRDSASDGEDRKTVIVLNASNETAAGSNLQNANHVVFLGPLLRDTQYGYDATMAQAIGRVRRHGQEKEVHVYRIVALDTIDVDILEHRERRKTALIEKGAPAVTKPPTSQASETNDGDKREKTQLVREHGHFSLRPVSWLVGCGAEQADQEETERVMGRDRVLGWEDFSSLVKFSKAFTENDD